MIKRIALIVAALLTIAITYRIVTLDDANAAVAEALRNDPQGERAQRAMLIWLADGRMYPVNYLREGDVVYMGIDGRWWRAFLDGGAPVRMLIKGETLRGHAETVLDDPARKADVFSRLRPTVPKWLPDWLNGKLVVIRLTPESLPEPP